VGFIQEQPAGFTGALCGFAPTAAEARGFALAGAPVTLPSPWTNASVEHALTMLRGRGANIVLGCTYIASGRALIDGLHRLRWAPYALLISQSVGQPPYNQAINNGWWQGHYAIGYVDWNAAKLGQRGDISNMTSGEFAQWYRAAYNGEEPNEQAAGVFAAGLVLVRAIELAGSIQTHAVAAEVRRMRVEEFYGTLSFRPEEEGMNSMDALVLQSVPSTQAPVDVVSPRSSASAALHFPMPSWATRECRHGSCENGGNGYCGADGRCICRPGWSGVNCGRKDADPPPPHQLVVLALVLLILVLVLLILLFRTRWYRQRQLRKRCFVNMDGGGPAQLPDLAHLHTSQGTAMAWHLFLSHKWPTGQQQCARIREQMHILLPGTRCFLDVHDLKDIAKLELYVEQSAVFLLFLSRAYFTSTNCLREIEAAASLKMPILVVFEPDAEQGGGMLVDLMRDCPSDLHEYLHDCRFIRWSIKPDFQNFALTTVAERLLEGCYTLTSKSHAQRRWTKGRESGAAQSDSPRQAETTVHAVNEAAHKSVHLTQPGSIVTQRFKVKGYLSLFCSPHNTGARSCVTALVHTAKLSEQVRVSSGVAEAAKCSRGGAAKSSGVAEIMATPLNIMRRPNLKEMDGVPSLVKAMSASLSIRGLGSRRGSAGSDLAAPAAVGPTTMTFADGKQDAAIEAATTVQRYWRQVCDAGGSATPCARMLVLLVQRGMWAGKRGQRLEKQVRRILASGTRVELVHNVASCPFTDVLEATPRELVKAGVYKSLAVDLCPGKPEIVSAAHFALAIGAQRMKATTRWRSAFSSIVAQATSLVSSAHEDPVARCPPSSAHSRHSHGEEPRL